MSKIRVTLWRILILVVGFSVVGSVSVAQIKLPGTDKRLSQEQDVRLAAFAYLFGVGTGPDPDYPYYCLSVDSDGPNHGADPSDSLMSRLPKTNRTIRKASECENSKGPDHFFDAIRDKATGKTAWTVSLSKLRWKSDHEVELDGERYCGGLCAWGSTLRVTFHKGRWKVRIAPGASIWVS